MLLAIGVKGANEEHIAILAQHHRGIEATAARHRPAVEGGAIAPLGNQEALGEIAAHGAAEGIGIGDRGRLARGIVDRKHALTRAIDRKINLHEGIGVGVAAAATQGNREGFAIVEIEQVTQASLLGNR